VFINNKLTSLYSKLLIHTPEEDIEVPQYIQITIQLTCDCSNEQCIRLPRLVDCLSYSAAQIAPFAYIPVMISVMETPATTGCPS